MSGLFAYVKDRKKSLGYFILCSLLFFLIFPLISARLYSVRSMSGTAFYRKSLGFSRTDNRYHTADAQSAVFRFCGVRFFFGS